MNHWLQPCTTAEIAKYIECYWFIEKQSDSNSYQYPKLNPDPSAHLILSPREQNYHYENAGGVAQGKGCHWLFPHQQTLQLDHSKPFSHLGIKFHIGALYSLQLHNHSHLSLDKVVEVNLYQLLQNPLFIEQDLIELARQDQFLCSQQLDALLLQWLMKSKQDKHSDLVRRALLLLDGHTISDLGNLLFCSQRTLERSFRRVTGLSLKQCQSMRKLEAMLEYLYQRDINDIDWVAVAYQFGFSDQPHLIRYIKMNIGMTPKDYAQQRNFTIDVYGGIESL